MNAEQARQVVLLRAVEDDAAAGAPAGPPSPLWSPADSQWADVQALRRIGEQSTGERFVAERALLGSERLAERDVTMAELRRAQTGDAGHVSATMAVGALLALALLAGLATDALGPSGQVNLLAPPLLALMAWNIVVYVVLLGAAAWRRPLAAAQSERSSGWLQGAASMLAQKISARRLRDDASAAAHRFAADWRRLHQPIDAARLSAILHLAAIAVAAGALLALYARGLAFEFRAGWDSTFVGATFVHQWLSILLAPAQAISGMPLPDAAHIETLRFRQGPGENAGRWIHWYAITTGLVMLPRLLLAGAAIWRARQLQQTFPLPMHERYFQRLLLRRTRATGGTAQVVAVLPYGHRLAGELLPAITTAIDHEFGPGLHLKLLANTASGVDDAPTGNWPAGALDRAELLWLLPLFALSATPEREVHGAFIRSVQQRAAALAGRPQCRVMIDESGFRQRLSDADLPRRLADRRAAWQKLLDEIGAGPALFVNLGERPADPP